MDKFKKGIKKFLKNKTFKLAIFIFVGLIVLGVVINQINKKRAEQYKADGQDPLKVINENGDMTGENVLGLRKEELVSGRYYILHNDRFYPLMRYLTSSYDTSQEVTGSSTYKLKMTTIECGQQIPTLYLENNDSLVYYDAKAPLSYAILERFVDEGISVGAYKFSYDKNNKYYMLSIKGDDEFPSIYVSSSASQLLDGLPKDEEEEKKRDEKKEEDNVSFFTITDIGGVEMSRDQLKSVGIIKNLEPGKSYNTSIYNGTNYNNYVMTADTWFFSGLEAYAVSDVPLKKTLYQTIVIPEYMKDGYYSVNNSGMFRLVHGNTWNTNMDLSSRLLSTQQEENKNNSASTNTLESSLHFEPAITTARYSENPNLNLYKTTNPSAFGYVAEDKSKEKTTSIDYERHEGQTPQPIDGTATSSTDNNKTENNKVEENKTSSSSSSSSSASTSSDTASSSASSSATQGTSQETSQGRTRK